MNPDSHISYFDRKWIKNLSFEKQRFATAIRQFTNEILFRLPRLIAFLLIAFRKRSLPVQSYLASKCSQYKFLCLLRSCTMTIITLYFQEHKMHLQLIYSGYQNVYI